MDSKAKAAFLEKEGNEMAKLDYESKQDVFLAIAVKKTGKFLIDKSGSMCVFTKYKSAHAYMDPINAAGKTAKYEICPLEVSYPVRDTTKGRKK